MSSETGAGALLFSAVSERRKVPLTFSSSVLAHPGGEEGLGSPRPDARALPGLEGRRREGSLARGQRALWWPGGQSEVLVAPPTLTPCSSHALSRAPLGLASPSA